MLDVTRHGTAPFDTALLDRLMEEAGIDVLIATSKHNIQYLLGGHRSFFFDNMDAIGISRYLPAFVYPKGAPDKAAYFGHGMETYQTQLKPFWVAEVNTKSGGSVDVMQKAADYVRGLLKKAGACRRRACVCARRIRSRRCARPCRMRSSRTRCSCSNGCGCARRRKNWKSSSSRPTW